MSATDLGWTYPPSKYIPDLTASAVLVNLDSTKANPAKVGDATIDQVHNSSEVRGNEQADGSVEGVKASSRISDDGDLHSGCLGGSAGR